MENYLFRKQVMPGIRFFPTDHELLLYYLKRKVMGKSFFPQILADIDVYQFAPWELPAQACLKNRDLNWHFFCPRARNYRTGGRTNRAATCGYWKSTGNDRTVRYEDRDVGKIKTLIFHRGKPPKGKRTDWVMHEYRLEDKLLADKGVSQDEYVICKVYEKSGLGPKNGEHYGAPFEEKEWESDDDENVGTVSGLALHSEGHGVVADSRSGLVLPSAVDSQSTAGAAASPFTAQQPAHVVPMDEGSSGPVLHFKGHGVVADSPNGLVLTGALDYQNAATAPFTAKQPETDCGHALHPKGCCFPDSRENGSVQNGVADPACAATEPLSPIEIKEGEIDRMLEVFSPDDDDIYNGLADLVDHPSRVDADWPEFVLEPLPPIETEEDEIDKMLEVFSADNDINSGLEDLVDHPSRVDADWPEFLLGEGDYFVELDDLSSST